MESKIPKGIREDEKGDSMSKKNSDFSFVVKERGTADEFEILRLVVNENPSIRMRVLEKIRAQLKDMARDQPKEKSLKPDAKVEEKK